MTNEILDEILSKLNTIGIRSETEGPAFMESLSTQVPMDDIWYLQDQGYIKTRHTQPSLPPGIPHWYLSITAEGSRFITAGGYTHQAFLKEEAVRLSREANNISKKSLEVATASLGKAKIAIWVSIAAIVVTIIIFLITLHHSSK